MHRTLAPCGVIVLIILAAGWPARQTTVGQSPSGESGTTTSEDGHRMGRVAVVDVKRILSQHTTLQAGLKALGRDVQSHQERAAVRQAEIASVQKKLQTLKPGGIDYEKAQLLLTRLQTELTLEATRRQQEFLKREMALYSEAYGKVTASVARYAKENGIQLVLRSEEGKIDPNDQKSVLGGVNRIVVYQQGLDITDEILADLNAEEDTAADM